MVELLGFAATPIVIDDEFYYINLIAQEWQQKGEESCLLCVTALLV